jgi:hypothetical protein
VATDDARLVIASTEGRIGRQAGALPLRRNVGVAHLSRTIGRNAARAHPGFLAGGCPQTPESVVRTNTCGQSAGQRGAFRLVRVFALPYASVNAKPFY